MGKTGLSEEFCFPRVPNSRSISARRSTDHGLSNLCNFNTEVEVPWNSFTLSVFCPVQGGSFEFRQCFRIWLIDEPVESEI